MFLFCKCGCLFQYPHVYLSTTRYRIVCHNTMSRANAHEHEHDLIQGSGLQTIWGDIAHTIIEMLRSTHFCYRGSVRYLHMQEIKAAA